MNALPILDADGQRIGTLSLNTFPHGHGEEVRRGTFSTPSAPGEACVLSDTTTPEFISIPHQITWHDARAYPDEVAFVESYPQDYFEIGKQVQETWIRAGDIAKLECIWEEGDPARTRCPITWGKAFSHLPACTVLLTERSHTRTIEGATQ